MAQQARPATAVVGTKPAAVAAPADTLLSKIMGLAPRIEDMLPKHMDPSRFLRIARLIVTQDPDLSDPDKTDPMSVLQAILDASRLGLELGREAHLVRYGRECTMLADYRGFQKLALETGALRVIEARVVYKDDLFEYAEGTDPHIKHLPALTADRRDAAVLAFYCIAFMKDGGNTFIVRTPMQIEHIRSKSRAKSNGPWVSDWQAMGMKTVIKEICDKRLLMLPNARKLSDAIELDNRSETGDINRPVEGETAEEISARVASRTLARAEDLKGRIGAAKAADQPKPAETEDERIRREDAEMAASGGAPMREPGDE